MDRNDVSSAKASLTERIVNAGYALPALQGLGAGDLQSLKTHKTKQDEFRLGVLRALDGSTGLLQSLTEEDLLDAALTAAPDATYMSAEQGGVFYVEELVRYALMKISSIQA